MLSNKGEKNLVESEIMCNFATSKTTLRDGAEVARRAHNPKVVGSNPAPATRQRKRVLAILLTLFLRIMFYIYF